MIRRRSTPWIHRWSRQIIGVIATVGALLTAYLTVLKFTGGSAACSSEAAGVASSCDTVLNSAYAEVFGLPLPLFGCLAYISVATLALVPLAVKPEQNKALRSQLEDQTWLVLFAIATAMTIFSGYLMYVLANILQAVCWYCIGSAIFSLSLLVLTVIGRRWEDIGQLFFIAIIVAMVTLIGTLAVYANIEGPREPGERIPIESPSGQAQSGAGWEITSKSGESEIELAVHLTEIGAKKYGAYWCPHCHEQKQLFGKEAFSKVDYIECDPKGKNGQPQVCKDAGVKSYPNWTINGELIEGVKTLDELADLSGYQGPRDFKYSLR
ncbi:MAG: vitamin K epoxide reductase family protein [Symploca sp. SIO2D2]|nr:vitamin K epoxide reductase family protein [Symploca sp. SIO2D2]